MHVQTEAETTRRRTATFRVWNRVHFLTGLVGAAWLLVMAVTGVLINHQEEWGLLEIEVPNSVLPGHYTSEYRPETNPLNVVLTDLHGGRFFGEHGKWIGDAAALLLIVSVITGLYSHRLRRRLATNGNGGNGQALRNRA